MTLMRASFRFVNAVLINLLSSFAQRSLIAIIDLTFVWNAQRMELMITVSSWSIKLPMNMQ